MILADGVFGLVLLGLWLFCLIDVITTPEHAVRNLPKIAWVLIVLVLVDVGSLLWLVAGRNWSGSPDLAYKGNRGARPAAPPRVPARASNPDDDEEFLAGLRARAEEQRRRAREAQERGEEPPIA